MTDDLVKRLRTEASRQEERNSVIIHGLVTNEINPDQRELYQSAADGIAACISDLRSAADAIDRLTAELEQVTVQYQGVLASIDNQSASAVNGLQAKLAEMTAERDAALGRQIGRFNDGRWEPYLGELVKISPTSEYADDWRDTYYISAMQSKETPGDINFSISDHWPPRHRGDYTDGWKEADLIPVSPSTLNKPE